MRIAQVAPLAEAVPPKLYGGTERVVSWLTEELVRQGHDVTLFASGDSLTSATLVPGCAKGFTPRRYQRSFGNDAGDAPRRPPARRKSSTSSISIAICCSSRCSTRSSSAPSRRCTADSTCRTSCRSTKPFPDMPFVSISDSQRAPMPASTNWAATIHHGLPPRLDSRSIRTRASTSRFSAASAPTSVSIARSRSPGASACL